MANSKTKEVEFSDINSILEKFKKELEDKGYTGIHDGIAFDNTTQGGKCFRARLFFASPIFPFITE